MALVWLVLVGDTSCTPAGPVSKRKDAPLYTPQRLFGEVSSASDVLNHEPFLERARLQREQEHDASARLALGAYVVARLVDKLFATETDESAIDGFRWQLDAVRRHIQDLPPDAPETAHLAGVVASVPAQGRPSSGLWMSLTAYAYFLEHEGRYQESLEIIMLAARSQGPRMEPTEFVRYALLAGRLNRLLTQWDPADACYESAEEAANSLGDVDRALRARLGLAHVSRGRGNIPRARTEVERIISEASTANLDDVQSDAYLDLGVVLMLQGLRAESLDATYRAFRLCQEPLNRMRILSNLGYGLNESGHFEAARLALEIVAGSDASHLVKLNALLELMQVESAVGNRIAFERRRQQVKPFVDRMAPSTAVDYRYKSAVGLARFGQLEHARSFAKEALSLAEQYKLNEWYFRLERMLEELQTNTSSDLEVQAPAEADVTPAVLQMTEGLREFASLATV
jgi:tetratricopeptide (TPR) repeat protein